MYIEGEEEVYHHWSPTHSRWEIRFLFGHDRGRVIVLKFLIHNTMHIRWFKSVDEITHYFSRQMRRQRYELGQLQSYLQCMEMGYAALSRGENHIMPLGETAREFADSCFALAKRFLV